ncbi:hypothetical protein SAMN05428966_10267 [Massilia sp. PDC64]|nr:hypothetical protein [Massilia sp. PDC64]SDC66374.1 hypothetical protein SAMN05428966_10267 [Massilia sp. PDC64]
MTPETSTALACAACFAVGFIGGFAGGFRVAAMIMTGVRKVRGARLRIVAADGRLREDVA